MKIKSLLCAIALSALPAIAQAQCMHGLPSGEAAVTCADGMTWDATAMACVSTATS